MFKYTTKMEFFTIWWVLRNESGVRWKHEGAVGIIYESLVQNGHVPLIETESRQVINFGSSGCGYVLGLKGQ